MLFKWWMYIGFARFTSSTSIHHLIFSPHLTFTFYRACIILCSFLLHALLFHLLLPPPFLCAVALFRLSACVVPEYLSAHRAPWSMAPWKESTRTDSFKSGVFCRYIGECQYVNRHVTHAPSFFFFFFLPQKPARVPQRSLKLQSRLQQNKVSFIHNY